VQRTREFEMIKIPTMHPSKILTLITRTFNIFLLRLSRHAHYIVPHPLYQSV